MYKTINEYDFTQAFAQSDSYKDQFSYGALKAIFAYYEELEESTSEPIEFDMIATCCEFTEYINVLEAFNAYSTDMAELKIDWLDAAEAENKELIEKAAREWLEDRTTVLEAINYNSNLKEVTSIVVVNF
jgi:hypothetical protein